MIDACRISPEVEPLCGSSGILEGIDFIGYLFLRKPHQRSTHQCAQRQRVTTIGNRSGYCDQVLDFLAAEKAFACLGGDWNLTRFKCSLVNPEAGTSWSEERNVAGTRWTESLQVLIPHRIGADQIPHEIRNNRCFLSAHQVDYQAAPGIPMLVVQYDLKCGDTRVVAGDTHGGEGGEP